ncbi:MAG: protein translocase subunit SecF [Candidatus Nanohaloarchaea archaeon]
MEFADKIDARLSSRFGDVLDNSEKYFVIPLLLIALSLGILFYNYYSTGEFLDKGTDFAGGTEITFEVQGEFNANEIEALFDSNGRSSVNAMKQSTGERELLLVEIPPPEMDRDEALRIMQDEGGYNVSIDGFSSISASVSGTFFRQAEFAFILAFTTMSIVIFYAFKDFIPSLAVVFAAAGDIIVAAGGMALFGIPLTLGSLAALLMLVGYSVDTDIVLSTRTLKMSRGSLNSRMWSALKTGVTMSSGGIAGFTLLYIVSYSIVGPSSLSNIASVMVIGLVADIPLTWFGNTAILKKYIEGDFENFSQVVPWI